MEYATGFFSRALSRPEKPQKYPTTGYEQIHRRNVEEENVDQYVADRYYAVHIGQVFQDRYQVIGKLGYGTTCTVWLARDLSHHCYILLKVYIAANRQSSGVQTELAISDMLPQALRTHSRNPHHIRTVLDSFEISGTSHMCLVYEPAAMSLKDFQNDTGGGPLFPELVRSTIRYIKADNILITTHDTSIFKAVETASLEEACPRKDVGRGRSIYGSYMVPQPAISAWGDPLLSDFGEAKKGPQRFTRTAQPPGYRSPEILLQMDWDHSVDIWNIACLVFHLWEDTLLFKGFVDDNNHSDEKHLFEIYSLIGIPPSDFLRRSPVYRKYFGTDGTWKGKHFDIPGGTLEKRITQGDSSEKARVLRFLRSVLVWDPARRPTARQLLEKDGWLNRA